MCVGRKEEGGERDRDRHRDTQRDRERAKEQRRKREATQSNRVTVSCKWDLDTCLKTDRKEQFACLVSCSKPAIHACESVWEGSTWFVFTNLSSFKFLYLGRSWGVWKNFEIWMRTSVSKSKARRERPWGWKPKVEQYSEHLIAWGKHINIDGFSINVFEQKSLPKGSKPDCSVSDNFPLFPLSFHNSLPSILRRKLLSRIKSQQTPPLWNSSWDCQRGDSSDASWVFFFFFYIDQFHWER